MGLFSGREFGILIAYVVPGFIALAGLSSTSTPIALWFLGADQQGPSVGGVFYLMVASIGSGMTVSAIRWATFDMLHAWLGLRRPSWDDSTLERRRPAYELLIEIHYRYYQFYSNMAVAVLFAVAAAVSGGTRFTAIQCLAVTAIEVVFFAASRDALRNYYQRSSRLLARERTDGHDKRRPSRRQIRSSFRKAEASGQEATKREHTRSKADADQGESHAVKDIDSTRLSTAKITD